MSPGPETCPGPDGDPSFLSLKLKFKVLRVKVVDADITVFAATAVAGEREPGTSQVSPLEGGRPGGAGVCMGKGQRPDPG